jgi:hypothetical protein
MGSKLDALKGAKFHNFRSVLISAFEKAYYCSSIGIGVSFRPSVSGLDSQSGLDSSMTA